MQPVKSVSHFVRQLKSGLLAWVMVATAGWIIGLLLTRVVGHATMADLDHPIRQFFATHQQSSVHRVMADVTLAGTDRVVGTVALATGLALRWQHKTWIPMMLMFAAYLGAATIAVGDKFAVARGHAHGHGLMSLAAYAFPSGHATQAAAVYATLALLTTARARRSTRLLIGMLAFALVLAVAFSRVYLGAHWFTDAAAGLLLGSLWAAALAAITGLGARQFSLLSMLPNRNDRDYDLAA